MHGTQKPVECMRRPMLNNSAPGQPVYEPFSGSGTSIIAAETCGRISLSMELDPAYVDVAVDALADLHRRDGDPRRRRPQLRRDRRREERAMSRGRRPKPTAIRRWRATAASGPGTTTSRQPPDAHAALPRASRAGRPQAEWRRVARTLHAMGVLTTIDRAALAAYCQGYARWVEAEQKLKETPALLKTPSGYVQQSPWLAIANKQLELMGRYMTELGMTPASRSRVAIEDPRMQVPEITFSTIYEADPVPTSREDRAIASRMEPKQ